MKFEEVLPAFREGKKIKRGPYELHPDLAVNQISMHSIDMLADDWEIVEESKGLRKPKFGHKIWFIDSNGEVNSITYFGHTIKEKWLILSGEWFWTELEAHIHKQKKLLIQEIKEYRAEHGGDVDWSNNEYKYTFSYSYVENEVECAFSSKHRMDTIYFNTEEEVQEVIELFGDRIKKYIFGVEDN